MWQAYGTNRRINNTAPANYRDWRDENSSFEALAAFSRSARSRSISPAAREPQALDVGNLTATSFDVLGIAPVLGRTLIPADATGDMAPR